MRDNTSQPAKGPPKPGPDDPLPRLSKSAVYESRQQRKDTSEARRLLAERDGAIEDARAAEQCAELVDLPAWTNFLLPMLDRDVRQFQDHDCWSAPGMSVDGKTPTIFECRAAASRSREIKETVLTMAANGSQYYQERAERAATRLQELLDSGSVRPEDLEERE